MVNMQSMVIIAALAGGGWSTRIISKVARSEQQQLTHRNDIPAFSMTAILRWMPSHQEPGFLADDTVDLFRVPVSKRGNDDQVG